MKTTAAQIYAGIVRSHSLVYVILLTKSQAGAETVGLFGNENGYICLQPDVFSLRTRYRPSFIT